MAYERYVPEFTDKNGQVYGVMDAETREEVSDLKSAITQLDNNVITESAGPASIVSIKDGADGMPLRSMSVAVEPVQDLHGYDHPWPDGGGKNLLECRKIAQTIQGVSFTPNLDAGGNVVSLTVNGTNTGSVILYDVSSSFQAESGQYILSGAASGSSGDTYQLDVREGSVVISGGTDAGNSPRITLDGSKTYRVCIRVAANATVSNAVFKPMIRLATEADSTFEPYSNICPISGWTGAKVTRTGKNLLACRTIAQTINGVSFTPNLDAAGNVVSVTVDGTNTAGSTILYNVANSFQAESGQYILSGAASGSSGDTYQLDVREGSVVISGGTDAGNSPRITLDGSKTYRVCIRVAANATVSNAVFKPMIRLATETDSTFETYQGEIYDITFPSEAGTVYGGNLTLHQDGSGEVAVTRKYMDVPSSGIGSNGASTERIEIIINNTNDKALGVENVRANWLKTSSNTSELYAIRGRSAISTVTFNMPIGLFPNIDAVKTFVNSNPLSILYELATPVTISLSASQITTLLGINNIWADTGDTTVEYPADTKLYIDSKITQAIAAALNA